MELRLKGGRTSTGNDARSGHPSIVTYVDVKEQIDQRNWVKRRISIYETSFAMSISYGNSTTGLA
jgi:hypothetical protein